MGWLDSIRGWFSGRRRSMEPTEVAALISAGSGSTGDVRASDGGPRPTAIGGSGTSITSGLIEDLDPATELRGENWYGRPGTIGVSAKMKRTPQVRQGLRFIERPLERGIWYFKPEEKDKPSDVEAAKFCDKFFLRSDFFSWANVLRIAGYARADGFSLAEMTDDVVEIDAARFPLHPGKGRAIVPTGFLHRPAWTVERFLQKKKPKAHELAAVIQYLVGSDGEPAGHVTIPADRLVRWTVDQEGANFAGFAHARSVHGAWKCLLAFLKLRAMMFERQGLGFPHIELPEDPSEDDIKAAQTILAGIRAHEKGWIITPHGYVFRWQQATASMEEAIEVAIASCKVDILFGFGTHGSSLGLDGKQGSYGLAESHSEQFAIAIDAEAEWVALPIWQGVDGWSPVRRIVDLNYGPKVGTPRLCVRNLPTRDFANIAQQIFNGITTGALTADDTLEDCLREGFKLPERDPTTARKYVGPAAKLGERDDSKPPREGESEEKNAA